MTQENQEIEKALGLEKASGSRFAKKRSLVWLGLAALIVAVGWNLWGPSADKSATQYKTAAIVKSNLTVIVTATGTVQPTNEVDVSSELSGTIRNVLVDYNDTVKVGQVLAELDTEKLNARVASSRAKLAAAKARVKNADATLVEKRLDRNRKQTLVEKKVYSVHDLDAAIAAHNRAAAALETAKADVAAATADLKLNETDLAKTCICSPIEGVILARAVEPGQTVASSLQAPILFTIAEDLTEMEAQVDVDEADVGKVREGQTATFTVDAYPDKAFPAQIRELRFGSEVVQGVVTYKAVLTADNAALFLRPGMTATAEIIVNEVTDVLTVPNAALRYSPPSANTSTDNRSFLRKLLPGPPALRKPSAKKPNGPDRSIWVIKDGEQLEVAVTTGATDGRRTQIVKGDIDVGQAVVIDSTTVKN